MTPQHSFALYCCIDFILGEGQGWGLPSTPMPYVAALISFWGGWGWGCPSTPVPYVAALISFCGGGGDVEAPVLLCLMLQH